MSESFQFLKHIVNDEIAEGSAIFKNLVRSYSYDMINDMKTQLANEMAQVCYEEIDEQHISDDILDSIDISDLSIDEDCLDIDDLKHNHDKLVQKHADRNGNGDDVFNASDIEQTEIGGPEFEHGYDHEQAKHVYEGFRS